MSEPPLDDADPPLSIASFGAETHADFPRTTKEYVAVAHDPVFDLTSGTFWFNPWLSKDHSGFVYDHLDIALDGVDSKYGRESARASAFARIG